MSVLVMCRVMLGQLAAVFTAMICLKRKAQ